MLFSATGFSDKLALPCGGVCAHRSATLQPL